MKPRTTRPKNTCPLHGVERTFGPDPLDAAHGDTTKVWLCPACIEARARDTRR
jgi:hypothetical protein